MSNRNFDLLIQLFLENPSLSEESNQWLFGGGEL